MKNVALLIGLFVCSVSFGQTETKNSPKPEIQPIKAEPIGTAPAKKAEPKTSTNKVDLQKKIETHELEKKAAKQPELKREVE